VQGCLLELGNGLFVPASNRRGWIAHGRCNSFFQRCRPSRVLDSTPRRAISGQIPRRRSSSRQAG
jgi:hypothetical protein